MNEEWGVLSGDDLDMEEARNEIETRAMGRNSEQQEEE